MQDDVVNMIRKLREKYYIHGGPILILGYRENKNIVVHVFDPTMPIVELLKKDAKPYELEISSGEDLLHELRKDAHITIIPLNSLQ